MHFHARSSPFSVVLLFLLSAILGLGLQAAQPAPVDDPAEKAIHSGDNGKISFSHNEVKFELDTMKLSLTPENGSFEAGSAAVASDSAATWTPETNTETSAVFKGIVGAIDTPKKGKEYNPTYSGKMKGNGGGGGVGGQPPVWNLTGKYQTFKVEITDKDGHVLTGNVAATVAVRSRFKAKITPTGLAGVTYQWKVDGSASVARTVAIKTYAQSIGSGPTPTDLVAADLQTDALDLFWCDVGDRVLRLEASVAGHMDFAEVTVKATQDADPNRNIYARLPPDLDDDHNPGGYHICREHKEWHDTHDSKKVRLFNTVRYDGADFFAFHQQALATVQDWMSLFHMPVITFDSPGPAPFSYLTAGGGVDESFLYHYVRLGEFLNLNELGIETASPWHNFGHGVLRGTDTDMGSPPTAIHSALNLFWRWHKQVDNLRTVYAADKAVHTGTTPTDGSTVTTAPTTFVVQFDLPVSTAPVTLNTARILPGTLTVNGTAATALSSSADHKTITFTITAPATGAVTVRFAGTRSVDPFATTFTITP